MRSLKLEETVFCYQSKLIFRSHSVTTCVCGLYWSCFSTRYYYLLIVFSPTFHITLHFCSGHSRGHPRRQTDAIFVHSPHSEVIGSPLGQAMDGQLTHFHRGVIALDPVLSSWLASAKTTCKIFLLCKNNFHFYYKI